MMGYTPLPPQAPLYSGFCFFHLNDFLILFFISFFRPADGVAQVSLALPKKRNSLTTEFWAEAKNVFEDLGADGSVRAVVRI